MSDLHKHFQYTALGNSIASGVGASFTVNDTKKHGYGYVYYFRDFLATIFPSVNLVNLADPGFTSSDLLQLLQTNMDARQTVKKADLITISIGGADLLDCILLHPTDPTCLPNAVSAFSSNWTLIMQEIRKSIKSHAVIFVMTVYNPFRSDDHPNFDIAEHFIQEINNVIKANRFKFHYKVVDVHEDFLGQFTNTTQWKVCIWTHFCEPKIPPDPHPTDSGHLEIARLHELAYLQNHPVKLYFNLCNDESSSDESSH